MKKMCLIFLFLIRLANSEIKGVCQVENYGWTGYKKGETKIYAVSSYAGKNDEDMYFFNKYLQTFDDSLLFCRVVAEENLFFMPQAIFYDWRAKIRELSLLADANDVLILNVLHHGAGLDKNKKPYGGLTTVENGCLADASEKDFKIAANLFCNFKKNYSLGLNQKNIELVSINKKEQKIYDSYGRECLLASYYYEAHGMILTFDSLAQKDKAPIIKKKYYLKGDVNRNGILGNISLYSYMTDPEEKEYGFFCREGGDERAITNELIEEEVWGLEDVDYDGVKDLIFAYFLPGFGWTLAVDISPKDCTNSDFWQVDWLDLNNDGVCECGDVNVDGDLADSVYFKERIWYADGLHEEEEWREAYKIFPGLVIVIQGACYGAGFSHDSPVNINYSFAGKNSYSYGSYFVEGAIILRRLYLEYLKGKEIYWLDFFNAFYELDNYVGWLEDNDDNCPTRGPWNKNYIDGFLASQIPLFNDLKAERIAGVSSQKNADWTKSFLYPSYPNPFNEQIKVVYQLDKSQEVELVVYDLSGRVVTVLIKGIKPKGQEEVLWQAQNLVSGIYYIVLKGEGWQKIQRITYVK